MTIYYNNLIQSAKYSTLIFYSALLDFPKEDIEDYFEQNQNIQFEKAFMFYRISAIQLRLLINFLTNKSSFYASQSSSKSKGL